ncbi:hypothetical protein [Parabacteroides sp. PF5-6]|uniref:hypothetical protein n=1 Tax=Parabacteroides sp. PF5-6 TaxID=1742403 RepID=UPI0024065E30|nr:hypothetical protein [Parabacteroides sp. PF5-6]MDF9829497.1 hypothetical protein [Parabacteroides sp. PF5-6]
MKTKEEIPYPSKEVVDSYISEWNELPDYGAQEKSLKKLFHQTYPENKDIDDILTKVCTLNTFYSTHIFKPYDIAKHIERLDIDGRLKEGNPDLVKDIAQVKGRNYYSFASKYCSHHYPELYPIYDSYVEQMLVHFLCKRGKVSSFRDSLKDYRTFCQTITIFREEYDLTGYTLKDIDRYLWLCGKKYFPKKYYKKRTNTN